jgi:hypothetical protein
MRHVGQRREPTACLSGIAARKLRVLGFVADAPAP